MEFFFLNKKTVNKIRRKILQRISQRRRKKLMKLEQGEENVDDSKKKGERDPGSFANVIRDGPLSDDDVINHIRMWNVWTKSGARATT